MILKYHCSAAHSFILDLQDSIWKKEFDTDEFEELISSNATALPEADQALVDYLNSFTKLVSIVSWRVECCMQAKHSVDKG